MCESWLIGVSVLRVGASLRLQLHPGGSGHNELCRGRSPLIEFGCLCSEKCLDSVGEVRGRPLLVLPGVLCVLGLGGLCVRVWQSADQVTPSFNIHWEKVCIICNYFMAGMGVCFR